MKKFFAAALCIALVAACFVPFGVSAETSPTEDYKQTEQYLFLSDFLKNNPVRSSAEQEKAAAEYLADKFDQILEQSGRTANSEILPYPRRETHPYGYSVQVTLQAQESTDKQVIIGAHLDSTGEGANDNAAGVTALYFILQRLAAAQLPVNVVVVAFGGEEDGLEGSYDYVQNMSAKKVADTLVMFNLDAIAGGDNLYVACENKKTDLASLIVSNGVNVSEKPYAVGTYPIDMFGYGYYERVQASDHTPFRTYGIPTASIFSGTFSVAVWDYAESANQNLNTMNTNADTLQNLDTYAGAQTVDRINAVTETVCSTILDDSFVAVAENAVNQLVDSNLFFNVLWPKLAVLGLALVVAVFVLLHYRKLQKRSIMGTASVKSDKVFTSPDAEEIFSFDDKKDDGTEDIFDIKK